MRGYAVCYELWLLSDKDRLSVGRSYLCIKSTYLQVSACDLSDG